MVKKKVGKPGGSSLQSCFPNLMASIGSIAVDSHYLREEASLKEVLSGTASVPLFPHEDLAGFLKVRLMTQVFCSCKNFLGDSEFISIRTSFQLSLRSRDL